MSLLGSHRSQGIAAGHAFLWLLITSEQAANCGASQARALPRQGHSATRDYPRQTSPVPRSESVPPASARPEPGRRKQPRRQSGNRPGRSTRGEPPGPIRLWMPGSLARRDLVALVSRFGFRIALIMWFVRRPAPRLLVARQHHRGEGHRAGTPRPGGRAIPARHARRITPANHDTRPRPVQPPPAADRISIQETPTPRPEWLQRSFVMARRAAGWPPLLDYTCWS